MRAIRVPTTRRRVEVSAIILFAFLAAACTGDAPETVSNREISSHSPGIDPMPTSAPPAAEASLTPHPEPRAPENSGLEPYGLSHAAATRIGSRLTMGRGSTPGVGAWTLFLYTRRNDRVGVGLQIGDGEPAMACCLGRLHSPARPLAYIPIRHLGGFVLAHIEPNVARVRYDCVQCGDARGFITYIVRGRLIGVPQLALVFVRPNSADGNDGTLLAFGNDYRRIDRDWIGLPPFCTGPPCPNGLAWGSLELGTERVVGP
jgi:hypothetical protein